MDVPSCLFLLLFAFFDCNCQLQLQIAEELPAGSEIGRIPVRQTNRMTLTNHQDIFRLDATTGQILTLRPIDREILSRDSFQLVIANQDQAGFPTLLTVQVSDVNDNSPLFPQLVVAIVFLETDQIGQQVLLDAATDADRDDNGRVRNYAIVHGNDEGFFRLVINDNFLHIENLKVLDRESRQYFLMNISATDSGTPARSGHFLLNITIGDINDCSPVFDPSEYVVAIKENALSDSVVLKVHATDNDAAGSANSRIVYTLANSSQFSVDADGVIRTNQPKTQCPRNKCSASSDCPRTCVLTVEGRDSGEPPLTGRAYVYITLMDENDHAPQLTFRHYPSSAEHATVAEDAANGTVVAVISVQDADEGLNGKVTVTITSGNQDNSFRLEAATFASNGLPYSRSIHQMAYLKVNGQFNRGRLAAYNLTITAVDSGHPSLNSSKCMTVIVNDVNDHSPVFRAERFQSVINEEAPVGSFVSGEVTATDADGQGINGKILYSIVSGNDRGWFTVNQETGLVTTAQRLDRELESLVRLNISARDAAPSPRIAYAFLTILIDDCNDHYPRFNHCPGQITFPEGVPVGTLLHHFIATDEDAGNNGIISYSLADPFFESKLEGKQEKSGDFPRGTWIQKSYMGSNEGVGRSGFSSTPVGELFGMDEKTGRLTTVGLLDRERQAEYKLLVIARDEGHPSQSSWCLVTVRLTDENDNRPIFYPFFYTIPCSSTDNRLPAAHKITQVKATDADEEGLLRYAIVYSSRNGISLDEYTGEISTSQELLIAPGELVKIQITATDAHGLSALVPATILLFSPSSLTNSKFTFEKPDGYFFSVKENAKINSVGEVRLVHHDSWENVEYFITDGDASGRFTADAKTGSLKYADALDREETASYRLQLSAWMSPYFASTTITISVEDENDNAPVICNLNAAGQMDIPQSWPLGQPILTVAAHDADSGVHGQLSFALVTSSALSDKQAPFAINRTTGSIYLVHPLSADTETVKLVVQVTDGGNLTATEPVHFRILPSEKCRIFFPKLSYHLSLPENEFVNSRVLNLNIRPCKSPLHFEIVHGNEERKFGIFPDGQLYLNGSLDRGQSAYYSLRVTASDAFHSVSTSVMIDITGDANHHQPAFLQSIYTFSLPENLPIGTFVGRVAAVDMDSGLNGEVQYGIMESEADFAIEASTGIIRSTAVFDREKSDTGIYTVIVTATDRSVAKTNRLGSGGTRSGTASIRITIVDENDNWPVFGQEFYEEIIPEGLPSGQHVAQITATDSDAGQNGQVTYSIQCPECLEVFTVDPLTGLIRLNQTLNYESRSRYDVLVLASDQAVPGKTSTAVLTIRVGDENDEKPQFLRDGYSVAISENAPAGTMLLQTVAVDGDSGQINYALTAGNSDKIFRVNRFGQIYLNYPLDYEKIKVHNLTVKAFEEDFPQHFSLVSVLVEVQDVNDNSPQFSEFIKTSVRIPENIPPGAVVATTLAHDEDSGANGEIRYSILYAEPVNGHFKIDAVTGQISSTTSLDRESHTSYRLVLQACDQPEDPMTQQSSEKAITIVIDDVNDHAPTFTNARVVIVPEYANSGYRLLTVSAVDRDADRNGHVTFDLTRTADMERFHLDRYDGHVYLRADLQQIAPHYTLSVVARDQSGDGRQSSTVLTVDLVIASRVGAENTVTFTQNVYEWTVWENATIGSQLGIVTARLLINSIQPLEYFLTGVTSLNGDAVPCLFDVDPHSGSVILKGQLDPDQGPSGYVIQIYAGVKRFSNYQVTASQIRLRVLSINNQAPVFSSPFYRFKVLADANVGAKLGQVAASDLDKSDSIFFQLSPTGPAEFFSVNQETGELFLKAFPTTGTRFCFAIFADDSIHRTEVTCCVDVETPQRLVPSFTQDKYEFTVFVDNLEDGEQVGAVTALGNAEKYEYFQSAEWFDSAFQVDRRTGALFVTESRFFKDSLDEMKTVVLQIEASAASHPKSVNSTLIFITLLHDNSHQQILAPISVAVSENASVGTCLTDFFQQKLSLMKADVLPRWTIYGDAHGLFCMTPRGLLCIKEPLDRETQPLFELSVSFQSGIYRAERRISVRVEDVNDEAPQFEAFPSTVSIAQSSKVSAEILRVHAVDRDVGAGGEVQYKLESVDNEFSMDAFSGIIRLNDAASLERKGYFIMEIVAYDKGEVSRSATATCTVVVQNENLHQPRFAAAKFSENLLENVSIGHAVVSLSATDLDSGLNGDLKYWIVEGNDQEVFEIDQATGQVFTAAKLDYESKTSFQLKVMVEDNGSPAKNDSTVLFVNVLNINDEPPRFPVEVYEAGILENFFRQPRTRLVQVQAVDADVAPFNEIQYSLQRSGDHSIFQIDPEDGWISLLQPLDREEREVYQVVIEARNSGFPATSATALVIITVVDENDTPPSFTDQFIFQVKENCKIGSVVGYMTATDPDKNTTLRYSSTSLAPFAVDASSGRIVTVGNLDRERIAEYILMVGVDDGQHVVYTNATIQVAEENDSFPVFESVAVTRFIPDSVPAGHFVYGAFAHDRDEDGNITIRYRFTEPSNDFSIDSLTGVVTVSTPQLYLDQAVRLVIQALDPAAHGATMTLHIDQEPTAWFPTFLPTSDVLTLSETTALAQIAIMSARASSGPLTYSIAAGNFDGSLAIDVATGQIRLEKRLDFEKFAARQIWIEAAVERAGKSLRTAVKLTLVLQNVNDNAPKFSRDLYEVDVEEEETPRPIVSLNATDPDGDSLTFQLLNGTEFFLLEKTTGVLSSRGKLDREKTPVLLLDVQATDGKFKTSSRVRITLRDKNDNPPKFSRQFTATVAENAPLGTVVVQVSSLDADSPANAAASYALADQSSGLFTIDPKSGLLTLARLIDREVHSEIPLEILVRDGSWQSKSLVMITVIGENDNAPKFTLPEYLFFLQMDNTLDLSTLRKSASSVAVNSVLVGQVTALDVDEDEIRTEISYRFKHPNSVFAIDRTSGRITTKGSFSPAIMKLQPSVYNLTVVAFEESAIRRSAEADVRIVVLSGSPVPPQFSQSVFYLDLPVAEVRANRPIMELKIRKTEIRPKFSVLSTNGSDCFRLDSAGMVHSVANCSVGLYHLQVAALYTDRSAVTKTDVFIEISQNPLPTLRFPSEIFEVSVPESAAAGSVLFVAAVDNGAIFIPGQVHYSLLNFTEVFQIDHASGAVRLKKQLDYERVRQFIVPVAARTHSVLPTEVATAAFIVSVINENDNPPMFEQTSYTVAVMESDKLNQDVLTVTAVDPDGEMNPVYYTIEPESAFFEVDSARGIISNLKELDYESARNHTLVLRAMDPADPSLFSEVTVVVVIEGVNEYGPVCAPGSFVFSISGQAPAGTKIGSVLGTDEDADLDGIIDYVLVGNTPGFRVNRTTGDISIVRDLSTKTSSEQHLHVLLRNVGAMVGQKSAICDVVIHVVDGKNTPYFAQKEYFLRVKEDVQVATKVGMVSAMTELQQKLRFTLTAGDDKGQFGIDSRTGEIKTVRQLDREDIPAYNLEIMASVSESGKELSSTAIVHINVDDVNDNAPFFSPPSPIGHVKENVNYETAVLKLNATDRDLTQSFFTYRLASPEWKEHFKIHPSSGVITAVRPFDRETNPEIPLKISVSDSGSPPQAAILEVKIVVDDVNDNPSVERPLTIVVYLDEFSSSSRRRIGNVKPTDEDERGEYLCQLVGENPTFFQLENGCELVAQDLAAGELYRLNVQGSDGKHEAVRYEVVVKSEILTKLHHQNSMAVRLAGLSAQTFLDLHYVRFMQTLFRLFRTDGQVSVFGLTDTETSDCVLQIAVGKNSTFLTADKMATLMRSSLRDIQSESGLNISHVDFKPCQVETCSATAVCEDLLQVVPHQTSITSGRNLLIVSPLFQYSHRCVCSQPFSGPQCQLLCPADYCQHGGTCAGNGKCLCPPGFYGSQCQFDLDECNLWGLPNCFNAGKCINTVGSFRCQCPAGFTGPQCEEERACTGPDCQHFSPLASHIVGFPLDSYMELRPWKAASTHFSLIIATTRTDAVLAFSQGPGRTGVAHFVSLEIKKGFVYFAFGSNARDTTRIMVNKAVSDGGSYKIEVVKKDAMGSLSVVGCSEDVCEDCPSGDESCSTVAIGIVKRQFFGNNSFYIGGLPKDLRVEESRLSSRNFVGCIKSLTINSIPIKVSDARSAPGVRENSCTVRDSGDLCLSNPCSTDEICVNSHDGHVECVMSSNSSQTILIVALVVVTGIVIILAAVVFWRYRKSLPRKKKTAYTRPPFLSPVSLFEQEYLAGHYRPQRISASGAGCRMNENLYKDNSCIYHASQQDGPHYYCVLRDDLRSRPQLGRPASHYASTSVYEPRGGYANEPVVSRLDKRNLMTSPADCSEGKQSSASTQPVDILSLDSAGSAMGRYEPRLPAQVPRDVAFPSDDLSDVCSDCDNCKLRSHYEVDWSEVSSRYREQPTYAEVADVVDQLQSLRHVLV